jgi:hypothetical protein
MKVGSSSWRPGAACVVCAACVIGPSAAVADLVPGSVGASVTAGARVVVPDVAGEEVSSAYRALRRVGLRVSIPRGFVMGTLGMPVALVRSVTPAPGTRVPAGSAVNLSVPCRACRELVQLAPAGRLPTYRVPEPVGHKLRVAYQ